jgi:hypothetical protein
VRTADTFSFKMGNQVVIVHPNDNLVADILN